MDVSVLNIKNNAALTAGVIASAANATAKAETKTAGDMFLDMMKQVNTTASSSSQTVADSGFIKTVQTNSMKSSAKKTDVEKTPRHKESQPVERRAQTQENDAPNAEKAQKDAPADASAKPDLSADKKTGSVGQKIPREEKDSAEAVESAILGAKQTVLDESVDESPVFETKADGETAVKTDKDAKPQETEAVLASTVQTDGYAAAAQQVAPVQTAENQAPAMQNGNVDAVAPEAVEAPETADVKAAPEEFRPQGQKIENGAQTAAPEEKQAETVAAPEQKVEAKNDAPVMQKHTNAAKKANAGDKADFAPELSETADSAPVENAYAAQTGRHTDATQNAQAQQIAQDLTNGAKLSIQVENNAAQASVQTRAAVKENTDADADAAVEDVAAKSVENAAQTRPAQQTQTIAPAQNASAQNDVDADANAQTRADTVNVLANNPNAQTQSFTESLKSSTAIEGVTATQTAGVKADASSVVTPFHAALKGKAQGTGEAAATQAKPNVPTNDLVDQIKVNIAKAAKSGLEKVTITLKPKELGNIQVSLEIGDDGDLKATIIASRASTLEMLQKDASGLQKALSDAGFKLNDNALNFSYRGEQQQTAQQFAENNHSHQRRYGGEQGELSQASDLHDDHQDDLTEAVIASRWSAGRHALNIRI